MRIAQVAPLAESVPPKLYGGTERVVSWLTEELVDMGHQVTLFASGDSYTKAKLEACTPRALRLDRSRPDPMLAYAAMLERVATRASEFDVIHAHLDWVHIPLLRRMRLPFVTTLHGRLDHPHLNHCFDECFGSAPFVSISDAQRAPLRDARWVATIYHGLPKDLLTPSFEPSGYLAFLGRITPDKGPDRAIQIARAAGLPLKIAAKIGRAEHAFFRKKVEPLLGPDVEFVGEIDDAHKAEFLGGAVALLFPIDWPEPFGLVMIEAMACGTPVIATPCGSVPEVVDHGVTGFVVGPDDASEAVRRVGSLDRNVVRAAFEQRFTSSRMATDYVRIYENLIANPPLDQNHGAARRDRLNILDDHETFAPWRSSTP